ncbi:MAG TPA: aldehyde dehydrogenase family protein [Candidatus Xenobia bacterium]|nr:aldehyde dehydrogenase family protein [Candidatus Xenobia bacterium]
MATATQVKTAEVCPNYVNGQWVKSRSEGKLPRLNPADFDDIVGLAPLSTREEMREAIEAAKRAFPTWRATPAPVRGRIVMQAARLMADEKDELARLMSREEGKTVSEALGEILRTVNILEYTAGEARRLTGETLPSELPKNIVYTIRQPLGVVGLITPWNFPVAVPVWKIAPALVCGNTIVWKPSELTPFTSRYVVDIFARAGVPAGVFNMVNGAGEEVGDELVEHPDVRAISFTGSCEVGALIYAKAARTMKKVQCEMGGKNPVVVLADADLELAAECTLMGAFGSTGQRCTATSRVIVENSIADKFVAMLAERARKLKVGKGTEAGTNVGPSVDENQFNKVQEYLEIGKREGQLVCGGERARGGACDKGWFTAPTIFDHVSADSRIAQEEIFGPVLAVIRVKDFEEAIAVANGIRYGLAASIFTTDANKVFEFADRVECGIVHINSPTVGGEAHVPFGGLKASGIGERETGSTAIDFYSELKIVYVDYTGRKRETNIY